MQLPARGVAAFGVAIRLDSLLLSAVAQPLAALLPYGCRVPLAGTILLAEPVWNFVPTGQNYARSRGAIPHSKKRQLF